MGASIRLTCRKYRTAVVHAQRASPTPQVTSRLAFSSPEPRSNPRPLFAPPQTRSSTPPVQERRTPRPLAHRETETPTLEHWGTDRAGTSASVRGRLLTGLATACRK